MSLAACLGIVGAEDPIGSPRMAEMCRPWITQFVDALEAQAAAEAFGELRIIDVP